MSQLFHLTCNDKSAILEVFEDGTFEFYGYDPEDDMIANEMGFVVDSDCWYIWDAICQETVTPALSDAVKRKNIVLIKALLALGADVNDDEGRPLVYAAENEWLEAVDLFLEAGASPDTPYLDYSPIVAAASNVNFEIVKRLLEAGADVHAEDDAALRDAAEDGYADIVKILLEYGADVHAHNNAPLRWAAARGHNDVVRFLLEYGADVHADNDEALRLAAARGHTDVVKILLEYGADVHAGNDAALRWAAKNGHADVVTILEDWIKDHG